MDDIVFEKPYVFVPPYPGTWWAKMLQRTVRRRLRRKFGIVKVESQGIEHLHLSQREGHGILLTPNHCRPADPFVVGEMARQAGIVPHTMASAHLFAGSKLQSWVLQRFGAFSVYREGVDRQAINAAIAILQEARRPLVIFPEGHITRANGRLDDLMEGTSFIARNAAKKRAQNTPAGKVVIHPIALRYRFHGDIKTAAGSALDWIERRLSWRPNRGMPLTDRITKVGLGLLALKEVEFVGQPQTGTIPERLKRLIDHLLAPMEAEWLRGAEPEPTTVGRVKKLRAAVLPDMVQGDITEAERERRWRQLADMYLAQQLSCYPPDYLSADPTPERLLETVERFEEDLTDRCRIYHPMSVTAHIGPAIPVSPGHDRGAAEDPVMAALEGRLREMIAIKS